MLSRLCNTLLVGVLCLRATTVLAGDFGYIKHKFVNNTPHECYVTLHQQYAYPIDACLGVINAKESKTCDGPFEPNQPIFLFDAVCNGNAQHLEFNKTVYIKNTYKSRDIEVTWTIEIKKRKLNLLYQEQGF